MLKSHNCTQKLLETQLSMIIDRCLVQLLAKEILSMNKLEMELCLADTLKCSISKLRRFIFQEVKESIPTTSKQKDKTYISEEDLRLNQLISNKICQLLIKLTWGIFLKTLLRNRIIILLIFKIQTAIQCMMRTELPKPICKFKKN